jgi:hypothetical protein
MTLASGLVAAVLAYSVGGIKAGGADPSISTLRPTDAQTRGA